MDSPHHVWPVVEQALERVKAKTGARWSPPFVLERIQSKEAGLFRFTDDGEHVAWMVVELLNFGYERLLHVWILEGEGLGKAKEVAAWIDLLAAQVGAVGWRLTGRRGWGKVLGLKPTATVFERILP